MTFNSEQIDSEDILLSQLKADNELAFEKIYWIYSKRIYGRLVKLLKDEDMADSILQDVFLRIWERREQIDLSQSFRAYLYKIAENYVYDYFRKVARDKRAQVHLRQVTTELYTHTEEDIYKKENAILINSAIENLPPQRKLVFTLCKIEGKTYEEAGQILGISISTVSNQLVKATRSVKEYVLIANGAGLTMLVIALAT